MAPPMVTPLMTPMKSRVYGSWSPVEKGITLTWRDLSVYALTKDQSLIRRTKVTYKRIINNVCGAVQPGSMVCIMGGSGAGKSTLMSALAFRNPTGMLMEGDVRVNGRPVGTFMHRLSGYMHQDDLFVDSLTVREHLTFMARLRMDRRTSSYERRRLVNDLLSQVGLSKNAETQIGSVDGGKKLSGGEKKRLSFAAEMLTDPDLLFCDEPTTGLDSYSAQKLVTMLKKMAAVGKTVICTIHQPSSEIFDMFHQLLLVADGRVAFLGDKESALEFFESQGYKCPESFNPADFFVRTLAIMPGCEESSRYAIRKICDRFAVSDVASQVDVLVQLEIHMGSNEYNKDISETQRNFQSPFWTTTLFLLTYRAFLIVLRDPTVQALRIVQKMAISLIVGLIYLGTIQDTQLGVQSVQGALFIFITENTFSAMYSVLHLFPGDLPLFMREYRSGLYSAPVYYLSKLFSLLPGMIVEPILFVIIAYWMIGLRGTVYAFAMTTLITTMIMNVAAACGCFFSNAVGSINLTVTYIVPFDYVMMITSGIFLKISTLPAVIAWAQYISWFMYSNEAFTIVQWQGEHNITCDTYNPDVPCLRSGQDVLDKFSFSSDHLTRNLLAMCGLYCAFHILSYLFMWRRAKK